MRRFGRDRALACLPLFAAAIASISGCQRLQAAGPSDSEVRTALATYAAIAEASYADSAAAARRLLVAVEALIAEPSAASLNAAREAWLSARVPYAQTEVFRFYDGPIDAVELLVNTWPIDETYVEAPAGDAQLGIIQDSAAYPELTRELLIALNGKQGETTIATGYHVIEFLLWGQDRRREGPGDRPYTDYLTQAVDGKAAAVAARRARYLELSTELLIGHLDQVADAWRTRPDGYRARFLGEPARSALARVFKGMGALGGAELAGERLTVAYETKNQENEHSCFSDSTHLDLAGNAQGIENICRGSYAAATSAAIRGLGVCELIERREPALGAALRTQIAASVAALKAIPAPFDTAILGSDTAPSRKAVAHAIAALQQQTDTLAQAAAQWQLTAPTLEAKR